MKKTIVLAVFLSLSCLSLAQQRWGFAFAVVEYKTDADVSNNYLFLSEVIDLTNLDCSRIDSMKSTGIYPKKKEAEIYKECLNRWFFDQAKKTESTAVDHMFEDDIIGVVRKAASKTNPDCAETDLSCFFLTKTDAEKVRAFYLDIAKSRKRRIIEVR